MKRIAPGYYKETVTTTLDGKLVTGEAEVCRTDDGEHWYILLECGDRKFLEGSDWYETKADAIHSLRIACENGFINYPGLGVCCKY